MIDYNQYHQPGHDGVGLLDGLAVSRLLLLQVTHLREKKCDFGSKKQSIQKASEYLKSFGLSVNPSHIFGPTSEGLLVGGSK